jgi:hypothetical protein
MNRPAAGSLTLGIIRDAELTLRILEWQRASE